VLVKVRVRVESKDAGLSLSLIYLGLDIETNVHLAETALVGGTQVVRFDEMHCEVTTFRVVRDAQVELSHTHTIFRGI
jgi:hypothetical protein